MDNIKGSNVHETFESVSENQTLSDKRNKEKLLVQDVLKKC